MKALSELPKVHVKLSMLNNLLPGWEGDEEKAKKVKEKVMEVIELFGSHRCMFASNFPVDKVPQSPSLPFSLFSKVYRSQR